MNYIFLELYYTYDDSALCFKFKKKNVEKVIVLILPSSVDGVPRIPIKYTNFVFSNRLIYNRVPRDSRLTMYNIYTFVEHACIIIYRYMHVISDFLRELTSITYFEGTLSSKYISNLKKKIINEKLSII